MQPNIDSHLAGFDLASLWEQLVSGRLSVAGSRCSAGRCYAELQAGSGRAPLPSALRLLERFLLGESQKSLALEHGLSVATIATHCALALSAFTGGTSASHAPIIVVMAAHAARGAALQPAVVQESEAAAPLLIHVPTPGTTFSNRLAQAEQVVAQLSIEGARHDAIARARGTSMRTIANQLGAVFYKLGVSGRAELRAKAIDEMSSVVRETRAPAADACLTMAPAIDQQEALRVA